MNRFGICWLALICAAGAACSSDKQDAAPLSKVQNAGTGGSGASGGSDSQAGSSTSSTGGNSVGASGGSSGKPATGGSNSGGTSGRRGTGSGGSNASGAGGSGAMAGQSDNGGAAAGTGGRVNVSRGGRGNTGGNAGGGAAGQAGGRAGTGGSSSAGGAAGGGATSPSDGCSSGTKPARGHYMITVGSTQRGYYLIPASADGPVPLVLEFHGAGGNGEGIAESFGIQTTLMGHSVIIAPDGVDQGGGQGIGWAGGNSNPDIDLVKALIVLAEKDHCIDTTRIYSLGFSWGGWMSTQVACSLGSQIRAFLSVSGGGPMGNSCNGPVAAMIVHGTADTAEPISSGMGTRDKFRTIDGCPNTTLSDSTVTGCQQYSGCTEPELWCQHSGGHEIPQFVIDGLPKFFDLVP